MALYTYPPTNGGWKKSEGNPVLGDSALGTCFDAHIMPAEDGLRMYFSWRPKKSLAVSRSQDGIHWDPPGIILEPRQDTAWEDDINRNCVLRVGAVYHMWYTGQAKGHSFIGYAAGPDGYHFERQGRGGPVLIPERYWENRSVMNPFVLWDEREALFKMWYSGGETYEPNAIGYAVSTNGITWRKRHVLPVKIT